MQAVRQGIKPPARRLNAENFRSMHSEFFPKSAEDRRRRPPRENPRN